MASKYMDFVDDPFAARLNTPIGQVKSNLTATPVRYKPSVGSRIRTSARNVGKYLSSDQFGEGVANVLPYVSNVVGLFRRPPNVPVPEAEGMITPSTVRYDAARANIDRAVVGANRAASRYLTGQAAGAVQAANLATQLGSYSDVAMGEANTNAQIRNAAAAQNAQITARNVARANEFQQDNLARTLAMQRESSENLANFADKAVQDRARRDMMRLDKEKFDILSRMYTSGVLERNAAGINTPGTNDPIVYDPSKVKQPAAASKPYWKKAYGGSLTRFSGLKKVHG